jgi:hypothetical protein
MRPEPIRKPGAGVPAVLTALSLYHKKIKNISQIPGTKGRDGQYRCDALKEGRRKKGVYHGRSDAHKTGNKEELCMAFAI